MSFTAKNFFLRYLSHSFFGFPHQHSPLDRLITIHNCGVFLPALMSGYVDDVRHLAACLTVTGLFGSGSSDSGPKHVHLP